MDASFIRSAERLKAKNLAKKMNADFFIIECILDDESIRERLEQRRERGSISDGRWEILEPQKAQFDSVAEVPKKNYIVVDTSLPAAEILHNIMQKI